MELMNFNISTGPAHFIFLMWSAPFLYWIFLLKFFPPIMYWSGEAQSEQYSLSPFGSSPNWILWTFEHVLLQQRVLMWSILEVETINPSRFSTAVTVFLTFESTFKHRFLGFSIPVTLVVLGASLNWNPPLTIVVCLFVLLVSHKCTASCIYEKSSEFSIRRNWIWQDSNPCVHSWVTPLVPLN